jgi:hypothetical protein
VVLAAKAVRIHIMFNMNGQPATLKIRTLAPNMRTPLKACNTPIRGAKKNHLGKEEFSWINSHFRKLIRDKFFQAPHPKYQSHPQQQILQSEGKLLMRFASTFNIWVKKANLANHFSLFLILQDLRKTCNFKSFLHVVLKSRILKTSAELEADLTYCFIFLRVNLAKRGVEATAQAPEATEGSPW